MTRPLRLVVGDQRPIFRAGLRALLGAQGSAGGAEVIGEAGGLAETVQLVTRVRPDVSVIDLNFADADGFVVERVAAASPRSKILVLTDRSDNLSRLEAFRQGALGYVLKQASPSHLFDALASLVAGRTYLDPTLTAFRGMEAPTPRSWPQLSRREQQVLHLLALGYTNSEIAEKLVISVRTAESHRSSIQRKLGIRSRAELARVVWDGELEPVSLVEAATLA
jgi:DNA-binding NarL/FixJ family response regulator